MPCGVNWSRNDLMVETICATLEQPLPVKISTTPWTVESFSK